MTDTSQPHDSVELEVSYTVDEHGERLWVPIKYLSPKRIDPKLLKQLTGEET